MPILVGQLTPQLEGTGFRAIPNPASDPLAGAATQRDPQPAFLFFAAHKRPDLIQFEQIVYSRRQQTRSQVGQGGDPGQQPTVKRAARHGEDPGHPAQADPFQQRPSYLKAESSVIASLGLQRAGAAAAFAGIFLSALIVVTVFHHLVTSTPGTLVGYNRLYHEKVL